MARVTPSFPYVRSGPSRKACYLRFINQTGRRVNVVWVDYAGGNRNYGTLEPNRHFDIHTYEGHPWVCEDSESKRKLLLNKKNIFYPASHCNRTSRNNEGRCYMPIRSTNERRYQRDCHGHLMREYVYISLPMFSLMERTAEIIIRSVHKKEDIKSLGLPRVLKDALTNDYFSS